MEDMEMRPVGDSGTNKYTRVSIKDDQDWLEIWNQLGPENGKIQLNKLKEKLLTNKVSDKMRDEFITRILNEADTDGDKSLDLDEFLNMAANTVYGNKFRQIFRSATFLVVPRSSRNVQVRSYMDAYNCLPPPLFMILIALIEIGAFIYYSIDMAVPVGPNGPCPIYSPLVYNPNRRYEVWRFFTYALIHSGYLHLVNNLVLQTVLGVALELVHKWWRVMIVYLSGVAAGALAASVTTPYSYLAGASGGVYAIEYAYIGNLILNWSEFQYPWIQVIILVVLMVFDVGYAVWDTYFAAVASNTGHMAHLGGAIAGVLVGINVLRNLKQERWEKYCWWVSLVVFIMLMGAAIIVHAALPMPEFFPNSDYSSMADQWEGFQKSLNARKEWS